MANQNIFDKYGIKEVMDVTFSRIEKKEETFEFPDLGVKVMGVKGASLSKIADGIFNELSLEEIKRCASITEKGLKDIGKADLIAKYKSLRGCIEVEAVAINVGTMRVDPHYWVKGK